MILRTIYYEWVQYRKFFVSAMQTVLLWSGPGTRGIATLEWQWSLGSLRGYFCRSIPGCVLYCLCHAQRACLCNVRKTYQIDHCLRSSNKEPIHNNAWDRQAWETRRPVQTTRQTYRVRERRRAVRVRRLNGNMFWKWTTRRDISITSEILRTKGEENMQEKLANSICQYQIQPAEKDVQRDNGRGPNKAP